MFGEFFRHPGRQRHNHWFAAIRWREINVDSDGFPLIVKSYAVEVEYSADGFDWFLHQRLMVPAKDDADDNLKVHRIIKAIHGKLAYRYRARALGQDCKADWSDYFVLGVPNDVPSAPYAVEILRAPHGIVIDWDADKDPEDDAIFNETIASFICELHTREDFGGDVLDFTADGSTNVFTSTAHPYVDTDQVMIRNVDGPPNIPDGVDVDTAYFVRDKTTNTFKLSLTSGGSAIDLGSDGDGVVTFASLVKRAIHIHHTKRKFNLDVIDYDEDTLFYGRALSVSDHRSKSAWIPATQAGNADPEATPTGKKAKWQREKPTFTIPVGMAITGSTAYGPPDRADDDHRIRRVTGAAHTPGSGGATKFDIQVKAAGGSVWESMFNDDEADMLTFSAGDDDASTNAMTIKTFDRGDKYRPYCSSVDGAAPNGVTIQIVCDRSIL